MHPPFAVSLYQDDNFEDDSFEDDSSGGSESPEEVRGCREVGMIAAW